MYLIKTCVNCIIDMSFKKWLAEIRIEAKDLSGVIVDQALEALGVATFMGDSPCQRSASPYIPSTDGWNKG
jgi:hypothetical protein